MDFLWQLKYECGLIAATIWTWCGAALLPEALALEARVLGVVEMLLVIIATIIRIVLLLRGRGDIDVSISR